MSPRVLPLLAFPLLFSCSLKYTEDAPAEARVPEIVFAGAEYLRYEDGTVSARLEADELEQYRDDNSMYARGVVFRTYGEGRKLSAEGRCDMISANTASDFYVLLGGVELVSHEDGTSLATESLRWDGRTEQLVSGGPDAVSISRRQPEEAEDASGAAIDMTGTGFSASGVSRSFRFTGAVSGTIRVRDSAGDGAASPSEAGG